MKHLASILLLLVAWPAFAQPQIFTPSVPPGQKVEFDTALFDAGGVIELPEGIIEVDRTFAPPQAAGLVLRGKGTKPTHIRLVADLGDAPLFDLHGNTDGGTINPFFVEISNVTIETDRKTADAFHLQYVVESRFDRVKILGFAGHGILADSLWDTVFTDVQVARCGDPATKKEAVRLADGKAVPGVTMSSGLQLFANCNNNHFIACRFENGPYTLLYVGLLNTKNEFVSCKWHGQSDQPTPSKSGTFDHIVIAGDGNTITSGNVTRCGANGIRLLATAHGTIIVANTIGVCDGAGILISKKAKEPQIGFNSFPHGWQQKNAGGDIKTE